MCRAELLFHYVAYVLFIARNNKTLQLSFRFREAQRFARNILNHQTFERPSLGNAYRGKVQFLLYFAGQYLLQKKGKQESIFTFPQ